MTTCSCWAALAALSLVIQASRAESAADAPQTNFVIFLADDLGWGDLGCYGNERIKTPNLDRFAKQGVRLTQCYAACGVCSPSRSALLTGRTPYRNGVYRWIPEGSRVHLRRSEITVARLLRENGYATCHVGKWHLNGQFNQPGQPQPGDHGFDHWMATQNNAAPSHKNPENFVLNGKPMGRLEGFSASLVAAEAIRWLREVRPKDRPFYLQVWTHEPHLPIESDPQFLGLYPDLATDPGRQQHHANVSQMDAAFGRVMEALDDLGLTDNTFVFFTSDNGPEGDGQPDLKNPGSQRDRNRGSTGGLRGRKRDDFEGGIRVPGLVRWPGRIEAGSESDQVVIGTDLLPTLCGIAGIPMPGDRVLDGGDMRPALAGKELERPRPLYWRTHISKPECRVAVRIGDWKVVGDKSLSRFLLFNLKEDPWERNDLSATMPEKLEEMKARLLGLDREIFAEGPDWWKGEEDY